LSGLARGCRSWRRLPCWRRLCLRGGRLCAPRSLPSWRGRLSRRLAAASRRRLWPRDDGRRPRSNPVIVGSGALRGNQMVPDERVRRKRRTRDESRGHTLHHRLLSDSFHGLLLLTVLTVVANARESTHRFRRLIRER